MSGILRHIMMVVVALALAGCGSRGDEPFDVSGGDGGEVTLIVKVGINSPDGSPETSGTRASEYPAGQNPAGYDYGFEDPATVYEGINTMRVIVVRPDDTVEGNSIMSFADHIPNPDDLFGDFTFAVEGGETKRVYVIANEASTPGIDWTAYPAGSRLTSAAVASLQFGDGAATVTPYLDNDGAEKKYVPMSEFFDVAVRKPAEGETMITETARLFITRSLVKFAFTANKKKTVDSGDKDNVVTPTDFRITEITVSGLATSEYLFPNTTAYLPAKSVLAGASGNRRIITAYRCPTDVKTQSYTFRPDNFGPNMSGKSTRPTSYVPQLYFLESPIPAGGKYTVTVKVRTDADGKDDKEVTYGPVDLPNLPSLPRNTFVKIDFNFNGYSLSCKVTLMPYIGVWLNPIFGLDTN